MNKSLSISACFLILFIWLLNTLASTFYWYSAMWWFDIPMHILGGLFLAILFGAIFAKKISLLSKKEKIVGALLFVLIVGIGWELFEYLVQFIIKGQELANIPDSIKDLLMDIIGGSIGCYFVIRVLRRYNKNHEI